ncbi:methylated-DNA--[protein]-cysteine S-methyltransferase [Parvibium lacunae]|uniref:Methylated-DNA--[protein]-cysteine S-methyltransferase n=1 Tax=Parvibium lacunae TaxID=1888893 RepID=A0A368L0B7_9BURK|nr:methylated-DNA--[protein]-cysteine S-methyltransferase [Parvibium lacunae]RCS56519.1 methylated-DNA--[protein]-cysteine S-methyltransferase [Parvibium lacunae]
MTVSSQASLKQRATLNTKVARFLLSQANYQAVIPTPFGRLGIRTALDQVFEQPVVYEVQYLPGATPLLSPQEAFTKEVVAQMEAYLAHPQTVFSVPLATRGTPFQQRLREQMLTIPCGQTQTYGAIAKLLKSGPRAVGQGCGANPFPLLIPCHRIVSASGIGGFARADNGFYIGVKRWLLKHEGALDG